MPGPFGFSVSICSSALANSASASSWVHSALYRRTCFPLIWAVKPQALCLVRWPGSFHSRWLTRAMAMTSVVGCSLLTSPNARGAADYARKTASSARREQSELPTQPSLGLGLRSQHDYALRPGDVDNAAVVTADADSFAGFVAVSDMTDTDDRAGHKPPSCVHACGRIDDPLAWT